MSAERGFSRIEDGYSHFGYACDHCDHTETAWRRKGRDASESLGLVNKLRGAMMRHVRDVHPTPTAADGEQSKETGDECMD